MMHVRVVKVVSKVVSRNRALQVVLSQHECNLLLQSLLCAADKCETAPERLAEITRLRDEFAAAVERNFC